jgi:hypothetical protein
MIENFAVDEISQRSKFQHDGTHPHYNNEVRAFLNQMLPD